MGCKRSRLRVQCGAVGQAQEGVSEPFSDVSTAEQIQPARLDGSRRFCFVSRSLAVP